MVAKVTKIARACLRQNCAISVKMENFRGTERGFILHFGAPLHAIAKVVVGDAALNCKSDLAA